jgi:hypothetical protein
MKRSQVDRKECIEVAAKTPTLFARILPAQSNGIERPSRDAINMLVSRPVADVFKQFCEIERYRYNEALEEIMKRAGLLPRDFGRSV